MAETQHSVVDFTGAGRRLAGAAMPVIAAMVVTWAPTTAHAEKQEAVVGIIGGAVFPGIMPSSSTTFAQVAWVAGLYSLSDDLSLRLAFTTSSSAGRINDWVVPGSTYRGSYMVDGINYHLEAGVNHEKMSPFGVREYRCLL